jgi:biopolymer transport protein ExbD
MLLTSAARPVSMQTGLKAMKRLFFAVLALAPLPAAAQAGTEMVTIEVRERGTDGCTYRAEGRRMSAEQIERRARTWKAQRRPIEIHGDRHLPYRCIGGVIYLMQSAGIEKINFIGKPIGPSVDLYVAGKGCAIMRNGELITMEVLRTEVLEWGRTGVDVTFQPDIDTPYECVDSVLAVLNESNVLRMGFVGNELNRADPQ